MMDALTYEKMIKDINENIEIHGLYNDKIAILITRPNLETGKQILENLEYYHFRTGKSINFYLPGYGAYWGDEFTDKQAVTTINGTKWYFSNEMFVKFIDDLENITKWKYSGESELLIIELKEGVLKYDDVLHFNLDSMIEDGKINSINTFIEDLSHLTREGKCICQISDNLGIKDLKSGIVGTLLEKYKKIFTNIKYYSVKNYKKKKCEITSINKETKIIECLKKKLRNSKGRCGQFLGPKGTRRRKTWHIRNKKKNELSPYMMN